MDNELFTSISNGDVKNSILLSTKIIFLQNSIEMLEQVYVDVCAYIGSCISLYDISKLIDIYALTKNIIENDQIIIKDIYVLVTKMCILCDIYNKHPSTKCGSMTIKVLKERIAPVFNNEDMKLSANGIMKFNGILPPHDHENYAVALRIIAIIIKTIKMSDTISIDNGDELSSIANKLQLCLDYITRTKYKFETKFYSNDNDNTWFIWGVFSVLYKDDAIANAFLLYNYEFKKKLKPKRLGIIWSLAMICIYIHKKDISKGWSDKELHVIQKIDEIAIKLYNEIRHKLIKEYQDTVEIKPKDNKNDGLNFILNYVPILGPLGPTGQPVMHTTTQGAQSQEIKAISY